MLPEEKDGAMNQDDVTLGTEKSRTPAQTRTLTIEEHEKALRDTRSAVMADVGRERKAAEEAMRVARSAQDRLDRMLKEQAQAELDAAKDDPEKLSAVQERQRRRQLESDLASAQEKLNATTTKLTEYESREAAVNRESKARDIAARLGIDPARLVKLSKFTDGTSEAIEEIAKELPKSGSKPAFRADSNASIGGDLTWEQIREQYIKDPRDPGIRARYMEARAARGR